MKRLKRGKYLLGSLLVLTLVMILLLNFKRDNLKQENGLGDINNYTPIAILEDTIVYNYIDNDDKC